MAIPEIADADGILRQSIETEKLLATEARSQGKIGKCMTHLARSADLMTQHLDIIISEMDLRHSQSSQSSENS